jgi:hypothetical protein
MTTPKHSTLVLVLAVALAHVLGSWAPVTTAHAAEDAAIVRVLTRIAVALEAGNRARSDR